MLSREQWIRRAAVVIIFGFAGIASRTHPEVTVIAIVVCAIVAAAVLGAENS